MMQTFRRIRAKAARSRIRVLRLWFWHLGLRSQDVFLASYPRSGSTWLRFILFEILTGKDAGFQALEKRLPEVNAHRGVSPVLPGGGRFIKTHEKYRKDYGRAVFLVRDLRDVFLSIYAGSVELGTTSIVSEGDLDSFLLSFLEGRALQVGSWQEHTRSWLESPLANNGNLMVVRYEDLRQNSEQVVGQLLEFMGVTPDVRMIRKAIENNALQQMRAKEDYARRAGERSGLLYSRKTTSEDGRFIRQGAIGGWRSKLTDAQLKIIWQYAGDTLAAAGYEPGLRGGGCALTLGSPRPRENRLMERYVTISVDDGHPTDLRTADLLDKYGLGATFYMPARHPKRPVMSAAQIREISERFEVGGHTMNHVPLRFLPQAKAWSEVNEGKAWLENVLGRRVISFCYPDGKFNVKTAALVKQAGFIGARTCLLNLCEFPRNPFFWGVSTHAAPHSKSIQLRHALLEQNFKGTWNFFHIYKGHTAWQSHFLSALDYVEVHGGIAHLYLHSWEIDKANEWWKLESIFQSIQERKSLSRVSNGVLFERWKAGYNPTETECNDHLSSHHRIASPTINGSAS